LFRCFLGAKLHRVLVTDACVDYVGSIMIDRDLLDLSGILPGERVQVADLVNGQRFETYVIEGERGSGMISINGAAALLVEPGHRVIVMQYVWIGPGETPPATRVVMADPDNRNPRLLV
jgi:aspartate 1-decarboxylase